VAALAPSARVIERWQGRSVEEAAALAPYAAKVAATGLPLGMVDDPELAAAARVAAVPGRDQRDRPPPGGVDIPLVVAEVRYADTAAFRLGRETCGLHCVVGNSTTVPALPNAAAAACAAPTGIPRA
jgi:hypothetical protein